ncbi:CoA transferase subunit A [Crassaminicella profunda]|uniref:CoA transferase subunit A n=1 Tax=Crassaminicella profunda TaxID=1286698 RepID=UPI001CA6F5DF|nr:3-oxoacid CoA-transferase subunit A [Crassaminicella profunda]QZY55633.1 3-oxoacid CoA-transferase subunit A [Crassaminicella profunda]
MNKVMTIDEVKEKFTEGMTLMIGGFMGVGTAEKLVDAVVEKGVKDLTVICNDAATPGAGAGKLVRAKVIKKYITSHIGLNPELGKQMSDHEVDVELVPQGTLVERIRSGGFGLGGVLTPTGVGTDVEEGKQKITIQGKEYLVELPLKGDVALVKGYRCDKAGNVVFRKSARNFNPIIAMACDFVVVEVEHIDEIGEIDPDHIMLPGIFVDAIIQG